MFEGSGQSPSQPVTPSRQISKHNHEKDPIAIVGIGCRFPGNSKGPEEFWGMLTQGVDAVTEIPPDRWNVREFYDPEPRTPGKTYARWGGFLNDIDKFDADFFGISPREATFIDPQHRLLLEVCYEAFEDGGQVLEKLAGSKTGVFIGISTNDYAQIQATSEDRTSIDTHTTTGGAISIASNRISYCFDLRGPSLSVDTACSSSLVAVHLACRSIWNNESTMALAGGVNIIICPEPFIGFGKLAMLSSEGRCKAFDATGNGFVRAEGGGVVLLKPLSHALADGDDIYAVIRGTAVNQDGRTNGITVPNEEAQASMLRDACKDAGVVPEAVQYIEAHGTGTAVGDPIETNALGAVLCANRPEGEYCIIGSVKTNLGHLEAGAGIAGLIKVALSLKNGLIPPNLHFREPNPLIEFEKLKLRVQQQLGPWPAAGAKLAGVNSFGFGGTNAHILLGEATQTQRATTHDASDGAVLLPFSAKSPTALRELAISYREFVTRETQGDATSLYSLGYNLSHRRSHHEHRLALVVHSRDELHELLNVFIDGENGPGIRVGHRLVHKKPKLGFVFSGQGPQWWGMGRQLLEQEPVYRRKLEQCDALLSKYADWSLIKELTADEEHSRMHETSIAQPSIFALQIALAELWRSWGVEPDVVVGHSVGEVAAAHIAGIYGLEDALRVIFHRGRCMDLASSKGKMLGVGITYDQARELIAGYADRVSVAAINSPSSVTLSGDPDSLTQIYQFLEEQQHFCRFLNVNYAFHSPQMEPVKDELLRSLNGLAPGRATKAMFSTVTGAQLEGKELTAEYWWHNVRKSVRFAEGINGMIDSGCTVFIELSPHPALAAYVSESLAAKQVQGSVLSSLRRKEEEQRHMLSSLGALYTIGYPVQWDRLYPEPRPFIKLPRYPWQYESYWHESEGARQARLGIEVHPLLGRRIQSADPTWRKQLSRFALPYLQDHKVQGYTVFPAAGYVELALAAAKEVFGPGSYVVEDLDLQSALFILEEVEPPIMQLTFYRDDSSFAISSRGSNSEWVVNAVGKVRQESSEKKPDEVNLETLRRQFSNKISGDMCYRIFHDMGLQFGPMFQGIQTLWRGDRESLGLVHRPTQLQTSADGYLFHPSLLDSCFQVLSGTLDLESGVGKNGVYLPVQIQQIRFYGSPIGALWSHAVLLKVGAKTVEVNLHIFDENGQVLMEIRGFKGQAVETVRESANPDNWIYEFRWLPKPRSNSQNTPRHADFLPPASTLRSHLSKTAERLSKQLGWKVRYAEVESDMNRLIADYIVNALRKLGWHMSLEDRVTVESLALQLGIIPRYHRLLSRFLNVLAEEGLLRENDGEWAVLRKPHQANTGDLWKAILQRFPAIHAELMLMANCGEKLDEVLQGKVDPLHLIFPEGSLVTAEHLYQDAPSFKIYNLLVAEAIAKAVENLPEGRVLRLLEIGGGTAGMTSYVLPKLPIDQSEYVFTDITPHFLHKAEQKFRDHQCLTYQGLDIEKDPIEQGFEPHSFDIILASDVLHATTDLRRSVENVKSLLASEGLLVLLETDNPGRWVDMVFGLTEGWWRFTDTDLRPSYPLLSREHWKHFLEDSGFSDTAAFSEKSVDEDASQIVIVSRGPSIELEGITPQEQQATRDNERWLIFADHRGIANDLVDRLRARGDACIIISHGSEFKRVNEEMYEVSPAQPEELRQVLFEIVMLHQNAIRGVIHCWSVDSEPTDRTTFGTLDRSMALGCLSVMHFIQAWSSLHHVQTPRLFLVTAGAQPVGMETRSLAVAQAPLCGLGRVITNEHHDMNCRMIDLSDEPDSTELQLLFEEITDGDAEDEVALRGRARFVQRLVHTPMKSSVRYQKKRLRMHDLSVQLESPAPGVLDNLTLRETKRRKPGPGEVEVQVSAAAMNFRDVMKALGIYPIETDEDLLLGDECAGKIVSVGKDVTGFNPGDDVIVMGVGCFRSYFTTGTNLVSHKPTHLSTDEAVTVPLAFLTAYYALHHVGRIAKGERVLIHAATGGVGLAAIQIAQLAGAEVFATAGTPEKRAFLRSLGIKHVMDSRSLLFADEVLEATGNEGVDIVLNSLAGEAIHKGIACLAPYGRFLEIGKRDIHLNTKLGLRGLKNNISFSAIYLKTLLEDRPAMMKNLLEELIDLFGSKRLHPLPYRVFPIGDAVGAFRQMAQAKHIGKIVISMQNQEVDVEPLVEESISFPFDATYLITGGLGGFGLSVAQWMVEKGVRNLVLVGRGGAATDAARAAVDQMHDLGARVVVVSADVSREDEVARVLADIKQFLPPLRGLIHAAMVLDDGILLQMDSDRFRKVMAPKVLGAWNLHVQTESMPLDFFVMFSSVTTMAGNPGQGNYVAANAFLDALAHHRRRLGLPALTVNWGHLSDVGYVARHADVAEHLEAIGLKGFPSRQGIAVFERLLLKQSVQVGVMDVDWRRWAKFASANSSPRFSLLISPEALHRQIGDEGSRIREVILGAQPEERNDLLENYLKEQIARVLGTSSSKLEAERPLNEMGLDSLMMVELKNRIEKEVGTTLPTVELMRGPTILNLSQLLLDQLTGPGHPSTKQGAIQPLSAAGLNAEELLKKVDQLSEPEVDSLLVSLVQDSEVNSTIEAARGKND